MDIQFWIWVIIVVVTLIARANKKKAPGAPPFDPSTGNDDPTKPISFEDLLKEIQAAKTPPTPQKPVVAEKSYDFEDYDEEVEEEIKPLEKATYTYADDQVRETYEKAKREAFSRASLEETLKVEDTVVKFGQFKDYQQVELANPLAVYLKELRDPEGFKKAFIMSEVLNRRF